MRTNKDAYRALAFVVGLPLGLSFFLGFPFDTMSQAQAIYLAYSILYFLAVFTPELIIKSYNQTPRTKLQSIRVSAGSLTSTGGLVALISLPYSETTLLEYFYEWIWIFFALSIVLSVLVFRLWSFGMNKASQKMLITGLRTIGYSTLCSAAIRYAYGLSPVQTFCSFLIILGVFNHLIWPGNSKLFAKRKKATPLAKRTIDFIESLSFTSGITLLISITPSIQDLPLENTVTFFITVFTTHWFFSLAKGSQPVNS